MNIPEALQEILDKQGIATLRPSQEKAIAAGLFKNKNLLICTPTASGKTLVGELGILHHLLQAKERKERVIGVYVVPLRALASEKFKEFSKKYPDLNIALTSGDMDSDDSYLHRYDIIITTSEKLDSLIRHKAAWISRVRVVVIDEIHLLNDHSRGPTLEILITLLLTRKEPIQLIGLSATIGNEKELAQWLQAELVHDLWRPIKLERGIYDQGNITFKEEKNE
jgi:helicase